MSPLLVSTEWLTQHLHDPDLIVVDVRWDAAKIGGGYEAFLRGHIPGAIFLDLDGDLSDRSNPQRGRHPLPDPKVFADTLTKSGIGRSSRVVAYDDAGGSIAARLWWMLRWIGCDIVSLMDGGLGHWTHENRPLESGDPSPRKLSPSPIRPNVQLGMIATMGEVESAMQTGLVLVDARAPERYRGEIEPIDFRAGHIPGAVNLPWINNLVEGVPQVFRSQSELRENFERHGIRSNSRVVCHCGSGVTACHNIVALELAGFPGARLYPGSWSEWIHHHP
ncbi:sulfurtransferase [bacterium]|nr:sulfurtransferase [bacterium]MBU1984078.1 sulfurtransferase [bacterium]